MGATGLHHASEIAILSANYVAKRLESDDIAKRLIDLGFHAPTTRQQTAIDFT